jgi:asparagine synthase (glutamine-hydrolysing)
MCGIVGVFGEKDRAFIHSRLARMVDVIHHRGPDDRGMWATDRAGFGMTRLSIIDLAGGKQPIWSHENLGIVFNGEIYNYRELRAELERQGVRFRTRSDTEVVLKGYEVFGSAFVGRLVGMFAFCIIDLNAQKAFIARDRLGKKFLHYYHRDGVFMFASEIKSIVAALDKKPTMSLQAINDYLTLRYVPAPSTIWQEIETLPPGHQASYDLRTGKFDVTRYWRLNFRAEPYDSAREYEREFESIFLDAVQQRLLASDVPVGTLLSGGLDSSAVSAASIELGHKSFHTFSVGFADGGDFSELDAARASAKHIESQHHEVMLGKPEFLGFLDDFVWFMDQPLSDLSGVPLYYVCKLAGQYVKVVTSGEGSDELFGGYGTRQIQQTYDARKATWSKVPRWAFGLAAQLLPGPRARVMQACHRHGWTAFHRGWERYFVEVWTDPDKASLWKAANIALRPHAEWREELYDQSSSEQPLDQLLQSMCDSWLVDNLLMKADRMSMACSVELRCPFLDHRLAEWAVRLPNEWKVGSPETGYMSKRIVREFVRKRMPPEVLQRKKLGFPTPANRWLSTRAVPIAHEMLLSNSSRVLQFFERDSVQGIVDRAEQDEKLGNHVWALVILEKWMRRWL